MLFGRIRAVVKTGTSVIYITHRLAEVRQIAHRVTVLRDGRVRGVAPVADVTDENLVEHDHRARAGIDVSAESQAARRGEVNLSVRGARAAGDSGT